MGPPIRRSSPPAATPTSSGSTPPRWRRAPPPAGPRSETRCHPTRPGRERAEDPDNGRQAQTERPDIKGLFPDDATKGKIESRPVLDWAEQQALETDAIVARLKRLASAEVAQLHEQAVNDAAGTARNQVRDWAAAARRAASAAGGTGCCDSIRDWPAGRKADTKAWEAQRNAETRDAVAGDFDMLVRLRDKMAAGNGRPSPPRWRSCPPSRSWWPRPSSRTGARTRSAP